jgi:hypothetical protein
MWLRSDARFAGFDTVLKVKANVGWVGRGVVRRAEFFGCVQRHFGVDRVVFARWLSGVACECQEPLSQKSACLPAEAVSD